MAGTVSLELRCRSTHDARLKPHRRYTIFVTALFSFVTCIWGACTNTWWHLFISRFFLGIGIGPKSATVPVFAAESLPAKM